MHSRHAPAQAGQFADDDGIAFMRIFQNGSDLPLAPGDIAGDFLFNELDVSQMGVVG